MRLIVGDKDLSSWSLRPWLAMRHTGIPFDEQVMLFEQEDFRDAIAAVSPSRRVPVLHDGDLVVWDSLAICEHVAERFPEARLWPSDPRERSLARAVSSEMHAGFTSLRADLPFDVTARVPRRALSVETEAEVRRIQEIWARAKGPFLFGDFSIADAMFAPVVFRFRTYDVPIDDPVARAFHERMLALPAMREWERAAEAEVDRRRAAARPPTPPPRSAQDVYAVVFSSQLRGAPAAYDATAARMVELAREQPGYLGIESVRGADGFGITVSYWSSLEAIRRWKDHPEHQRAQRDGRSSFYSRYDLRVCRVDRAYRFP